MAPRASEPEHEQKCQVPSRGFNPHSRPVSFKLLSPRRSYTTVLIEVRIVCHSAEEGRTQLLPAWDKAWKMKQNDEFCILHELLLSSRRSANVVFLVFTISSHWNGHPGYQNCCSLSRGGHLRDIVYAAWYPDLQNLNRVLLQCSVQVRIKYGRALKKGEWRLSVCMLRPNEKEVICHRI